VHLVGPVCVVTLLHVLEHGMLEFLFRVEAEVGVRALGGVPVCGPPAPAFADCVERFGGALAAGPMRLVAFAGGPGHCLRVTCKLVFVAVSELLTSFVHSPKQSVTCHVLDVLYIVERKVIELR